MEHIYQVTYGHLHRPSLRSPPRSHLRDHSHLTKTPTRILKCNFLHIHPLSRNTIDTGIYYDGFHSPQVAGDCSLSTITADLILRLDVHTWLNTYLSQLQETQDTVRLPGKIFFHVIPADNEYKPETFAGKSCSLCAIWCKTAYGRS